MIWIAAFVRIAGCLDMVPGRTEQALKSLAVRPRAWRDASQVVATNVTGIQTDPAEELPDAVAVMDHSMRSASSAKH